MKTDQAVSQAVLFIPSDVAHHGSSRREQQLAGYNSLGTSLLYTTGCHYCLAPRLRTARAVGSSTTEEIEHGLTPTGTVTLMLRAHPALLRQAGEDLGPRLQQAGIRLHMGVQRLPSVKTLQILKQK